MNFHEYDHYFHSVTTSNVTEYTSFQRWSWLPNTVF